MVFYTNNFLHVKIVLNNTTKNKSHRIEIFRNDNGIRVYKRLNWSVNSIDLPPISLQKKTKVNIACFVTNDNSSLDQNESGT